MVVSLEKHFRRPSELEANDSLNHPIVSALIVKITILYINPNIVLFFIKYLRISKMSLVSIVLKSAERSYIYIYYIYIYIYIYIYRFKYVSFLSCKLKQNLLKYYLNAVSMDQDFQLSDYLPRNLRLYFSSIYLVRKQYIFLLHSLE